MLLSLDTVSPLPRPFLCQQAFFLLFFFAYFNHKSVFSPFPTPLPPSQARLSTTGSHPQFPPQQGHQDPATLCHRTRSFTHPISATACASIPLPATPPTPSGCASGATNTAPQSRAAAQPIRRRAPEIVVRPVLPPPLQKTVAYSGTSP